jgi:hypothetical protein
VCEGCELESDGTGDGRYVLRTLKSLVLMHTDMVDNSNLMERMGHGDWDSHRALMERWRRRG